MDEAKQREVTLFEAALQLPPSERAPYLEQACGGDAGLRRRVEDLLGAFDRAAGFMRRAAVPEPNGPIRLPPTEKPGDSIDRYKLLEQIGEGGCGVVYMAEQQEPVRRRVALKVIKLGMDTRSVIARFEAERQALALMDHPNIARVLDAGATETGRPFFVMELVRGTKVTDYCDQNNLSTGERLKLFTHICQAIQHAHQKGIIHRDIKPSNVLVTLHDGVPVPKVIDFGIAKATTDQRLTEKTLFSQFEQFLGTPAYMSPEQAERSGLDIDTRSDIYSLGVLLYELLTGKTPFDTAELLQAGLDAMRRTIREKEPECPSTRLSTLQNAALTEIARHRQAEPRKLTALVRGDLDWIVMKCLEKDRGRRYETANGLAADISRHLNSEPIAARPPSGWYEFQKTVRRHKFGFGAGAALVIVLSMGVLAGTVEALRARRAERTEVQLRKLAQAKEKKSEQVAKFLTDALFAAGPAVARGRDATLLREILEKAGERVGRELKDQPEEQGDLWFTIGMTHWDIGDHPRAITNLQHAIDSYGVAFADGHPKLALALTRLGRCQSSLGDVVAGKATAQLGLDMARKCPGTPKETLIKCLIDTGASLDPWTVTSTKALPYLREALALGEKLGTNADNLITLATLKGKLSTIETNAATRESLAREVLALHRRYLPPGDLQIAQDLFSLGQILLDQDKVDEGEAVMRQTVDVHANLYDKKHPRMPIVRRVLIGSLARQGKWDEAEGVIRAQLQDVAIVPEYWLMLVRLKAARGDWKSGIDEARRVRKAKIPQIDYDASLDLAVALLHEQQHSEYDEICRGLLDQARWTDFRSQSLTAAISLLQPVSGEDFKRGCELADKVVRTNDATLNYFELAKLAKALADYRRSGFAGATNWAARVVGEASDWSYSDAVNASAWFVQAAANACLKETNAARSAFAKGSRLADKPHVDFDSGVYGGGWGEWEIANLLRLEAFKLIGEEPR